MLEIVPNEILIINNWTKIGFKLLGAGYSTEDAGNRIVLIFLQLIEILTEIIIPYTEIYLILSKLKILKKCMTIIWETLLV